MKLRYLLPLMGAATLLAACNMGQASTPESLTAPATGTTAESVPTAAVDQAKATAMDKAKAALTNQAKPVHLHYKDVIKGNEYKSYSFKGVKGQQVTAKLKVKGNANVFLYGYDDFVAGQPYTLPDDAMYELRVVQPRNSARKNATSSFELSVDVK